MKKIFLLLVVAFAAYSCGQMAQNALSDETIDNLIEQGMYSDAQQLMKLKMATEKLTPKQVYDYNSKIDVLDRIRKDFRKDDTAAIAYIKKVIPDVTPEQLAHWESTGALECKVIDGVKKYFWNAPRNLFRIDKEAQKHWDVNGRQSDELDIFLGEYLPKVVENASVKKVENVLMPQAYKIKYTITVKANEVPDGEVIRVWLPYPMETERSGKIKLLSTTQPEYIISPDSYVHKSMYMQAVAKKDQEAVFGYELEYTAYNHWFNFGAEDVKPYNTESELYKKYTAERNTHVIFTPLLKQITDSIIAGETNPYNKALRIFDFISENIPWASAREYTTFENIPEYVLKNRHGDCGQVSLTFIAMARYAGIPAKWQSGFVAHPGMGGMHDWCEIYFEGIGWVPVDASFGLCKSDDDKVRHFYFGSIDSHRYYVNEDYSGEFFPAKTHLRSEPVDFQRGEVEWKGENLYFGSTEKVGW